ncbi:hypothetical protein RQP46_008990 [Phenoliferia psychrophenolica]
MAHLDPLPRQRRRFELAEVCHQWYSTLQLDFEFVVPGTDQHAQRLADRFKSDGTGHTALRLSVQILNNTDSIGAVVALLRECTHLRELRLVAPTWVIPKVELEEAIKERKSLKRLELNISDNNETRMNPSPYAASAYADWYFHLPNLKYLDTGILNRFPLGMDVARTVASSSSSLETLDFHLHQTSLKLLFALITVSGSNLTSLSLGIFPARAELDLDYYGITIESVLALLKPLAPHLLDFEWDPKPIFPALRGAFVTPIVDLSFLIALRHLELGSSVVAPGNVSACISNIPLLQNATIHLQHPTTGLLSWTTEEAVQEIGDYVASAGTLSMLKLIPAWRKGNSSKKFDPEHHWDEEQLEWMGEQASENGVRLVVSMF